jgi:23S rRNA (cytidine1920-2'-O)/16S rRNA (cytidine1409-2'-O)-methyltransferase
MAERLDKKLAQILKLSRNQAHEMIIRGEIFVDGKREIKPSKLVEQFDNIERCLEENSVESDFVGRGAYKLKKVLDYYKVDVTNLVCADVGASTGGFTDLLLQRGAKKSYAIDVGTNQLAKKLLEDPRCISLEGVNVREGVNLPEKVDMIVVDLSFISLRKVWDPISELLKRNSGQMIVLFKPQFEVGREFIGKNGLVKDKVAFRRSILDFKNWLKEEKQIQARGILRSPITGKSGNAECLFYIQFP